MKLAIIIPAYNEEKVLEKVLKSIPKNIAGIDEVLSVVVDDGSSDLTAEIAKKSADYALSSPVNMGVGTATKIGLEAAKKIGADIVLTMDADGQHDAKDILALVNPIIKKEAEIVLGARDFSYKYMPAIKVVGNWLMNLLTLLVFHKWVSDSQSGMKAFSRKAIELIQIDSIGYEICSEIIGEAKHNKLKILEVPIKTIYTDYSKSRGQNIFNAVNIFTKILALKFNKRR